MINKFIYLLSASLITTSCAYQADQVGEQQSINKFNDPVIIKINDWQDRRMTDSLIFLLENSDNPLYKKETALALASVQDKKAIPALAEQLDHSSPEVRKMAAYALGQTYDSSATSELFDAYKKEEKADVKYYILEAAGKTASKEDLDKLLDLDIESQKSTEGMAWALYRAGIRNVFSESTTQAALNILDTASSKEAQLAAAHYLGRLGDITIPDWGYITLKKSIGIEDPEIRMAVASAYKTVPPQVSASVFQQLLEDEDYRVRVNAVKALPVVILKDLQRDQVRSLLLHENPNVGVAMGEKLINNATLFTGENYQGWIEEVNNTRIKALLFQAGLKGDEESDKFISQIKEEYASATSPYYKAALLQALSEDLKAHKFIITETFRADHPAISTAGISALAHLRSQGNFPEALKPAFNDILKQAIESGDAAMIDVASAVLRNPSLEYKEALEDIDFLYKAKEKLKLPKENETLQSLEKTIAYLEGVPPKPVENKFNNPIDRAYLEFIENEHSATIKTKKGDIEIILYTNQAPGSVLNFVELARKGYYDNKGFHRVVPNFVAQAGGNRGDGWGGEDYSIRSEFGDLKYTTGTIGMASAGKDTEGTQWFITHSPTPHLDGRYTIFAQVINGMDVVHRLEVGDSINTVIIKE
ncbi:MAG: peptidylprolyl isomerase [Candidatus Cyclobacteriaceae bacterium M2_1C_046]